MLLVFDQDAGSRAGAIIEIAGLRVQFPCRVAALRSDANTVAAAAPMARKSTNRTEVVVALDGSFDCSVNALYEPKSGWLL
jgi:hypothetical protein